MAFGFLPHFDLCCGSLQLKMGCIIMCIFTWFAAFMLIAGREFGVFCATSGFLSSDLSDILAWVLHGASIFLAIAAVVFLIGIFASIHVTATIYTIAALLTGVVRIGLALLALVGDLVDGSLCKLWRWLLTDMLNLFQGLYT